MSIQVAGGVSEDGIIIGNTFDKYGSRNPIVKWMMNGFEGALSEFVAKASPNTIHEVGCGEGYWVLRWNQQGLVARGSDFSKDVIALARKNSETRGLPSELFKVRSIYELDSAQDKADLVVCCEVFEHLDDPDAGFQALQKVVGRHLIVSVPREPLWRVLNMARGKYVLQLGNTPGHIQHWSRKKFTELVSQYFDIVEIKSPLPWTMLLCRPQN